MFSEALRQGSALHLVGNLSDNKGKYGDVDHLIYLLGLAKILVRRGFEPLPFQRDDALIAREFRALLDREMGPPARRIEIAIGRARAPPGAPPV